MITLTNVGAAYDAIPASKALGMVELECSGIAQIGGRLFVNKIGTGTQSWQLWNVTDNTEVGVINDNGVAGDKYLSGMWPINLTGVKVFRWRAKSTVGGDDPIFYCATMRVIRG